MSTFFFLLALDRLFSLIFSRDLVVMEIVLDHVTKQLNSIECVYNNRIFTFCIGRILVVDSQDAQKLSVYTADPQ